MSITGHCSATGVRAHKGISNKQQDHVSDLIWQKNEDRNEERREDTGAKENSNQKMRNFFLNQKLVSDY